MMDAGPNALAVDDVAHSPATTSPVSETPKLNGKDAELIDGNNTSAEDVNSADDMELSAMPADEASALKGLTEDIQNQDDLERDITQRVNLAMIEHEDERDQKRIDKVKLSISKLRSDERKARQRLESFRSNPFMQRKITTELEKIDTEITALQDDVAALQNRIDVRHQGDGKEQETADSRAANRRLPNESQRDFLLRTGKITPFSSLATSREGLQGGLDEILVEAEEEAAAIPQVEDTTEPESHRNLQLPGFGGAYDSASSTVVEDEFHLRPRKKRRIAESSRASAPKKNSAIEHDSQDFTPSNSDHESEDDDGGFIAADGGIKKAGSKRNLRTKEPEEKVDLSKLDDGNEENYQKRLRNWVMRRSRARAEFAAKKQTDDEVEEAEMGVEAQIDDEEEWHKPCPDPSTPDHLYHEGVKLPGDIYHSLFGYQRVGVQWLGEMYAQSVGGILADEMGLGKTIQIISFLAGLHFSKKLDGPVIIVAPATVLSQWVQEFHQWWPPLRVSILHSSGSGMLNVGAEEKLDDEERWDSRYGKKPTAPSKAAKRIADTVLKKGHVLVTTYAGLQTYREILIPIKWSYAVLDEGHKIRNPESSVTYSCKSLQTPNRVILSGTPIQNNLIELWSLFDFVCPMRLSNLVTFRYQFDTPIKIGGYANATNLQVLAAEKCAQTLKDVISPYFMQRLKADVASDLPKKSEQVLFCKLTKSQREAYKLALVSPDIVAVMNGQRNALAGIDTLTKICNHPDLADAMLKHKPGYHWGNSNKSGKMQVVKNLLRFWKNKGDKVLLFNQGKLMLNILEDFIKKTGYNYLRMDGDTPVKTRHLLVDRFNEDPDVYIFLLTTKVGGQGVNLTSANRVIIFDPNWNPSTDIQARERAWRLGQKREVTIFRLMTAGTIEEKIYHRQIYKQFLTNKILKDASSRSTFQPKDLFDLFTLSDTNAQGETETGKMFQGTEVKFSSPPLAASTPRSDPSVEPLSIADASSPGDEGTATLQSPISNGEDVSQIAGIHSAEAYQSTTDEQSEDKEERLMSGIFARSGVYSALSHDEVINGKPTADRIMTEREAERIAREGRNVLRRAGEEAQRVPAGQVTWTGLQGETGRPPPPARRGGPSSAGVLANLSIRQNTNANGTAASSSNANARPTRDFARLLSQFINRHSPNGSQGQGVPTKMILDHFNPMCRGAEETREFKKAFERVCVAKQGVSSRRSGLMRWVLRDGA